MQFIFYSSCKGFDSPLNPTFTGPEICPSFVMPCVQVLFVHQRRPGSKMGGANLKLHVLFFSRFVARDSSFIVV